jgi:hypothetical protein
VGVGLLLSGRRCCCFPLSGGSSGTVGSQEKVACAWHSRFPRWPLQMDHNSIEGHQIITADVMSRIAE